MNVTTSSSSSIILEAWLPSQWNGRFLSTGNGGLNGCIGWGILAYANAEQFAAVGANNGHNGTSGKPFLNSPEVVEDFAYRSVYTGAVIGKQVTEQFYASAVNKSYYLGCSTGGRQAWKFAQDFPDVFDGIVAGSPALDFNHLTDWSGYLSEVAGFDNTSSTFIPARLWGVINAEILRQCDALDGAADGIIESPDLCRPYLERLICPPNTSNTSSCLNPAQYDRAVKSLEPLYNASGTLIFPRLQPGAQAAAAGVYFTGQPFPYTSDWFKYAVYNNPSWDPRTLGQADFTYLDSVDPYGISTFKGDLSAFAARGGRVITYHGMQDPVITSDNSARYYSLVSSVMGVPPSSLDEFYRYFRISGMGHCAGGPGAWDIGQGNLVRPQGFSMPGNSVLNAIVAWVENAQAPDMIEGIKWVNDTAMEGVSFKRRHCRYPYRNMYNGTDGGMDENGWQCVL